MARQHDADLAGRSLAMCRWHGSGPCSCSRAGHALAREGRRGAPDLAGQGLAECRWHPGSAGCECKAAASALARKRNPAFALPRRDDHPELDPVQFRLFQNVLVSAEDYRRRAEATSAIAAVDRAIYSLGDRMKMDVDRDFVLVRPPAIDFMEGRFTAPNPAGTPVVQAVAFPSGQWTAPEARAWLKAHGLEASAVERTAHHLRYEQRDPRDVVRFVTQTIHSGGKSIELIMGERGMGPTPGPWIVGGLLVSGDHRTEIAMVREEGYDGPMAPPLRVAEANAYLIAAAPILLDACEAVLAGKADALELVRKAVLAARRRRNPGHGPAIPSASEIRDAYEAATAQALAREAWRALNDAGEGEDAAELAHGQPWSEDDDFNMLSNLGPLLLRAYSDDEVAVYDDGETMTLVSEDGWAQQLTAARQPNPAAGPVEMSGSDFVSMLGDSLKEWGLAPGWRVTVRPDGKVDAVDDDRILHSDIQGGPGASNRVRRVFWPQTHGQTSVVVPAGWTDKGGLNTACAFRLRQIDGPLLLTGREVSEPPMWTGAIVDARSGRAVGNAYEAWGSQMLVDVMRPAAEAFGR